MNSILTALYWGKILPFERGVVPTKEQMEIYKKIDEEIKSFTNNLTAQEIKKFDEIGELTTASRLDTFEDTFAYGFRLGALMIMDVISDKRLQK